MRGEYAAHPRWVRPPRELPPRARRIPVTFYCVCYLSGTTSACAENTSSDAPAPTLSRNYLRVRGEYDHQPLIGFPEQELPPRARRIQRANQWCGKMVGTTSACAENTLHVGFHILSNRNYLRVRGEYTHNAILFTKILELPPRARRIHARCHGNCTVGGTTSACAENTYLMNAFLAHLGNYLRVRGEYTAPNSASKSSSELPPRARRIPPSLCLYLPGAGTTSACAENT